MGNAAYEQHLCLVPFDHNFSAATKCAISTLFYGYINVRVFECVCVCVFKQSSNKIKFHTVFSIFFFRLLFLSAHNFFMCVAEGSDAFTEWNHSMGEGENVRNDRLKN